MRKFLLLLLAALFALPIFAEKIPSDATSIKCTVSGSVIDSAANITLPYPTISVVRQKNPQAYILRTVADTDGNFSIDLAQNDTFIIVFESIGLMANYKTIITNKEKINLGKIMMKEAVTELEEMIVAAQKPLVKSSIDRIAYDIASDPDAQTSSTLQMLNKVPLLTVDQEDKIKVKGSTKYMVHINGKPSNLIAKDPSMALKSIPASTVERIEVITEPGAKYDSEGLDGIINIVTKSAIAGHITSINASASSTPGAGGGIYFTTKAGKFGMSLNAQYHYGSQHSTGNSLTEYKNSSTKYNNMSFDGLGNWHYLYGNLEASYEFDSLRLLSLSVGGNGSFANNSGLYLNDRIGLLGDTITSYSMDKKDKNSWSGLSAALNYQRSFKKQDQNLTFSYLYSYTPQNTNSRSNIIGVNYPSYQQKINSLARNDEHTFQVDYTEPFAKKHIMEVGAKYILRMNNSLSNSFILDTTLNQWNPDLRNNDDNLNQMQHIVGAYGSYSLRLKKWNFRFGTRLEYMMQNINNQDTAFDYSFFNVIPNVNISYNPAESHHLSLGYTQRLSRPGIYYLNPFYNNSDPYNIRQGNPDLNPEIGHMVSLSYGYYTQKVNMNLSLNGSYVNNSIQSVSSMLNDSTLYTTYENIGETYSAYANLYVQWTICKWANLWANVSGSYSYLNSNNDLKLQNEGWNIGANGGFQFSLPWKLKLGAYGGYSSPSVTLQGTNTGWYYYSLSLNRAFLKNKLNIGIQANNFAQPYIAYKNTVETSQYLQTTIANVQAMQFSISVSYRFGEMKEQIKTVKKTIKNTDSMSGNSNSQQGGAQKQ